MRGGVGQPQRPVSGVPGLPSGKAAHFGFVPANAYRASASIASSSFPASAHLPCAAKSRYRFRCARISSTRASFVGAAVVVAVGATPFCTGAAMPFCPASNCASAYS